ncbi:NAD(P)-dependent oxidoreductase [Ureibacillus suwonensis]|uniref:NAD(P)-dependent oxidoreductase n=1 Tax=Ureibacillus suwonensis TaxID=313007 RepID=A0ABW0RBL1_9BACL
MKVLVIGATGRTGQELVKQSLEKGYEVRAYVRRPEAVPPQKNLEVFAGNLDDIESLTTALKDVDAVLMALGNSMSNRNDKLFEWVIPNLITAMKAANVKRIVSLSALGVGNTFHNTRYPYRLGARTFLKGNFEDHLAGEIKFKDSGLDWTTVHPGPLFNGEKMANPLVRDAATGYKMPRVPRTNRADVAQVMLKALLDPSTYGKELVMASTPDKN